ncbi:MAG: putative alternative 3-dehydroquinate synthase [Haloquadratum walsbyi J07HQW1]|jgi:3-dehydroquinate synthase II|uniref:3-dehydroquinate synthase n=1 Tax=Haloquadratum walsbyi J07HQW1 TaxID=1238424 RepID=U1N206_9EURY|nr:MAG: putative alternative 3-dehydroquinate synthase [Haloquadratum walsbyi J07HQW1]
MAESRSRRVWIKADSDVGDWETRKRRITTGLEAGVDCVLVDPEDVSRVRALGDVSVAAFISAANHIDTDETRTTEDADTVVIGKESEGDGTSDFPETLSKSADLSAIETHVDTDTGTETGAYVRILSEEYETLAETAAADASYTIVVGEDWTIIPLENLIARIGSETTLITGVTSAEEAQTAFETLEIGADGVLLDTDDPDEIRKTVAVRDATERETLELEWATIVDIERAGMADRVCVDTANLMQHDEGMLIGSMSRGLLFVHAETAESPYVASRPFRVNAGAVHAYLRTPDGGTAYLSELQSGDKVQIVNTDGQTREGIVGRVKIEKRPMFRIEAEYDDDRIETLLQNAETIKVNTQSGRTAVTDLEPGDEIRLFYEKTARHFGEAVEESIIEK